MQLFSLLREVHITASAVLRIHLYNHIRLLPNVGTAVMGILIDKYSIPEIPFGVEMEMNFAVSKDLHKAFVEKDWPVMLKQIHA